MLPGPQFPFFYRHIRLQTVDREQNCATLTQASRALEPGANIIGHELLLFTHHPAVRQNHSHLPSAMVSADSRCESKPCAICMTQNIRTWRPTALGPGHQPVSSPNSMGQMRAFGAVVDQTAVDYAACTMLSVSSCMAHEASSRSQHVSPRIFRAKLSKCLLLHPAAAAGHQRDRKSEASILLTRSVELVLFDKKAMDQRTISAAALKGSPFKA